MKEFFKKHPRLSKGIALGAMVMVVWLYFSYEYYAIKRNAFIAGCVQGSHGDMNRLQCWSVYHATGYN